MKIKVTLKHIRTKKVRTEVMECQDPLGRSFVGEIGNKTAKLYSDCLDGVDFSIKAYEVIKVESDAWVWRTKK